MLGKLLRKRYEITQPLGVGGFGHTYLAKDLDLPDKPDCVVKQLKPASSEAEVLSVARRLFDTEAKILHRLGKEHDRIPTLFASFEESGEFYLVQEYIDGHDLTQELTPGKRLSESYVTRLLQDILEVLKVAHDNQVIHRDVKPANLIRRRKDGKIFLIDFGAVKEINQLTVNAQGQTNVTVIIGTPGYTPVEQWRGRPQFSSDIYAVGMVGIQALTGIAPESLPEDPQTGEIIWRDKAQVSDRFADILDVMVRDEFRQRYPNATEALKAFSEPPPPPSPTVPTLTTKFTVVTVNEQGKVTNRSQAKASIVIEDLTWWVKLEMIEIPGGRFLMGSPQTEAERDSNESPQHWVTVSSFYMSKYPITQSHYQAVMGNNPSHFKGGNRPVEMVSWNDAVEFCRKLSQRTGHHYRLPSEAEWEYACRAGTTTPFHFGETITSDLANYNGNLPYGKVPQGKYRKQTAPVGSFGVANAFGIYDMHGNVWEWCQDVWHENYNSAPTDGKAWERGGDATQRLLRGGSWDFIARNCRSANRNRVALALRRDNIGFRVVRA